MDQPCIGPFFYIKGRIYAKTVSLDKAKQNVEGIYDADDKHISLYPFFKTQLKYMDSLHPYEYWPRGRVVYNGKEDTCRIFLDSCIKDKEGIRKKIVKAFSLEGKNVEWGLDGHYRCHRCNPFFVDID